MSWKERFSRSLGLIESWHVCTVCEAPIPDHPGRHPRYCPNCGVDMVEQSGYPSPRNDVPAFAPRDPRDSLSERVAFWRGASSLCDAVHARLSLPSVPWSPNRRSLHLEAIDREHALFSLYSHLDEACSRVLATIKVPLEELTEDLLSTRVDHGIKEALKRLPSFTLSEVSGRKDPVPIDTPTSPGVGGGVSLPLEKSVFSLSSRVRQKRRSWGAMYRRDPGDLKVGQDASVILKSGKEIEGVVKDTSPLTIGKVRVSSDDIRSAYVFESAEIPKDLEEMMGSEAGFFSSDPQRGAGGGPSPRTTSHAVESSYRTACAVIVKDEKYVLLGRADPEVTDDDRGGLWCFPGGGIDPEDGGDVSLSAEREAFEEAGVKVRPTGTIIDHPESPGVAFVICTYLEGEPTPNAEFSQLSWVPWAMRHEWEGIYPVNLSVLERIPPGMISEDYRSDVARIRYQDESFEDELSRGIEVEREHTDDPKVARKIALDHLREDPEYYTKLKAAGIKGESIRVWTSRFRSILEKAQKLSQKASSVGKHQVTGGVGAEPDARALPGTSLKAPEKQKQIDGGIKKQDTEFTRSKTLSDPGEEGGARSVEKARELQGREPSGQAPSQTQTQGAAGKPPQAPQTGQNAGEAPQQAPQQALLPQAEKTVDLAFPSKDQADRAFQWLRALGLDYVTADGTKIRVQVQSQEEMALVNRTAQAFGLSLSSLAA